MNWHKFLYKYGFFNIGYKNKFETPLLRTIEPFAVLLDGILGIILLPTSVMPNFHMKIMHKIIKAKGKKYRAKEAKK